MCTVVVHLYNLNSEENEVCPDSRQVPLKKPLRGHNNIPVPDTAVCAAYATGHRYHGPGVDPDQK